MPGMDGKGPNGTGPVGRGLGPCRASNTNQDNEVDQSQQPVGAGGKPGMGQGNRCGGGAGRGGRGGGRRQGGGNR